MKIFLTTWGVKPLKQFQFILGENLLLLQLGVHHWHKERRVLRELNLTLVQHKLGVDDLRLLNNLSNHLLLLLLRIKPAKRCCKQQRIVTRNKKHWFSNRQRIGLTIVAIYILNNKRETMIIIIPWRATTLTIFNPWSTTPKPALKLTLYWELPLKSLLNPT